jgi:hypothetical protein
LNSHRKQTAPVEHGHDFPFAPGCQRALSALAGPANGFKRKLRHDLNPFPPRITRITRIKKHLFV